MKLLSILDNDYPQAKICLIDETYESTLFQHQKNYKDTDKDLFSQDPFERKMFMIEPQYKDFYFGMSDSRNEMAQEPSAFTKSYVDLNKISVAVVEGQKFLIMGPKGTGKSALAWFLKASEVSEKHQVLVREAATLPLAEVPRLQTGQNPGPERTVVAWKFILLCNYMELLLSDARCTLSQNNEVKRVARILRQYGFMGDASGKALLSASSTTVTIPVPKLGTIYKRESQSQLNIFNLLPYMEEWVAKAGSSKRHVLLLDGLDSIFLNDKKYDESLASLVQAAYDLNQKLLAARASGSIVLLIRNDVFSRISLSLPDSQKMRDDLSLELDWRVLSGRAGINAPLLRLVNAKAGQALGLDYVDVLKCFPDFIEVGGSGAAAKQIETLKYLLNLTRHTPRDLLRLLEEIRRVQASGIYADDTVLLSQEVIREGVLQYSTKYFVGAIGNEFAGYSGGPESADSALKALKSLNERSFNRKGFCKALERIGAPADVDPDSLLRLLFYAGALGNYVAGINGQRYMQFYHRRDDAEVYLQGKFILHEALIYAWGMRRNAPIVESDHDENDPPLPPSDTGERSSREPRRRTYGRGNSERRG